MNRLNEIDPTFAPPPDPTQPPPKEPLPDVGQNRMGVWLFILSLAMLFAGSIIGYVIIRVSSPTAPPPGTLEIPKSLWISTVVLVGAGVTFHRCQKYAREMAFEQAERWLIATIVFSLGFLLVQVPAVLRLVSGHGEAMKNDVGIYGLTLSLIVIHAAHVIGGLIPLGRVALRAVKNGINSSHVQSIRLCSIYWHFLEIVWIVMFVTFLIVR